MKIIFKKTKRYGKEFLYAENDYSKIVLDMLERTCLKKEQIQYLEQLGHTVEIMDATNEQH